jgi:acyl carrier protein
VAKAIEQRKGTKEGSGLPEGSSAVRALVAERLGRPADEVRGSQQLSTELGLSSIDRIELLSSLEERYGVELPEAEMASVATVEELERFVHREAEIPALRRAARGSPLGNRALRPSLP